MAQFGGKNIFEIVNEINLDSNHYTFNSFLFWTMNYESITVF